MLFYVMFYVVSSLRTIVKLPDEKHLYVVVS
jgi:hypothetical protein